jgi:SAM-dependent methyltransferase
MRTVQPEVLDRAPDADAQASLRDLERINRWFGGDRIALGLISRVIRNGAGFTLLDVGSGSGGAAHAIRRAYPGARIVSLDRQLRNLRRAPPPRVAADAFDPPFANASFDIVFCSLFLHHFPDADVVRMLATMRRLARLAVIAVDLERHGLARRFLGWTRWALDWHEITIRDGAASVESAFTLPELARLASHAGMQNAAVRLHRPWFRVSLFAPAEVAGTKE